MYTSEQTHTLTNSIANWIKKINIPWICLWCWRKLELHHTWFITHAHHTNWVLKVTSILSSYSTLIKEVIPLEQVTSIFQVIEKEWIAQWTEHQILKALFQYLIQMRWLYHSCSLKYLSFYIYFLFLFSLFNFLKTSGNFSSSIPSLPMCWIRNFSFHNEVPLGHKDWCSHV